MATFLQFSDGTRHKIISEYMVQPYRKKYLTTSASIITEDSIIEAKLSDNCEGCGKTFDSQPVNQKFLSEDMKVNKRYGRTARVCVICFYRPYHEQGMIVPPPLHPYF